MTPTEAIAQYGWTKGAIYVKGAGVCLIGSCRVADGKKVHETDLPADNSLYENACRNLHSRRYKRKHKFPMGPWQFNDDINTTKEMVLSFLRRVERLVARITRSRSPLTITTVVTIPIVCLKQSQPTKLSFQRAVEPDARNYSCDNCQANSVFGAQETLLMLE